jgi:hypothetical protein
MAESEHHQVPTENVTACGILNKVCGDSRRTPAITPCGSLDWLLWSLYFPIVAALLAEGVELSKNMIMRKCFPKC